MRTFHQMTSNFKKLVLKLSSDASHNPSNMQERTADLVCIIKRIGVFLSSFKDREGNYKYFDKINNMIATSSTSITIDYIDFDGFSPTTCKGHHS